MLNIIEIQPTVGKSLIAAVVSEKHNGAIHSVLTEYVRDTYGEFTSIAYLDQFAVPVVLVNRKIDLFINADDLINIL